MRLRSRSTARACRSRRDAAGGSRPTEPVAPDVTGGLDVERIPILRLGRLLLVTIQVDMHDRLAMTPAGRSTARIATRAHAVLDRHLFARHGRLVHRPYDREHRWRCPRVLDALETVVVGMRPAATVTLRSSSARRSQASERHWTLKRGWPSSRPSLGARSRRCRRHLRRSALRSSEDVVIARLARPGRRSNRASRSSI